MTRAIKHSSLAALLPLLLGIIAFLLVAGPKILNPENIAWLVSGDMHTQFIGWQFFRTGPWGFPLGLNHGYGLDFSNAIAYSDSIPLLAILLKPFSGLLPNTFQYFGWWLFACFVLQAWLAWKLVGLVSQDNFIRFFAAGLFVFSPPMIWRLHGHLSLVGHFLILAGLYLSFRKSQEMRVVSWALLVVISALVHAYLLAMVALIWLADLLTTTLKKSQSYHDLAKEFLVDVFLLFLACWQAGYFSVGTSASASTGVFGSYRMNLFSLFDSSGWSYFLPDLPEAVGDYEGFNYLGLGLIATWLFAVPVLLAGKVGIARTIRGYPALVLVLLLLTTFSVSNNIGLGSWNLSIGLPDSLLRVANVFRASGRMFWPVFYVLVFVAVFLVVRGYSRRVAVSLLALALLVQVIDTSAGWRPIRRQLMQRPASEWTSPLKADFWTKAASLYRKVRLVMPRNYHPYWSVFADYAARYHLATDAVYLARIDGARLAAAVQDADETIHTGRFRDDSIYILDNDKVLPALLHIDRSTDLFARIDGFNVVAPGWKRCAQCPQGFEELRLEQFVSAADLGKRVDFSPTATRHGGVACNIDRINESEKSQNPIPVSGYLAVYGWAAIDPKNGVVPDAVAVVLKAPDGSEKFALAIRNSREDVAKYFGQAKLRDAGFFLRADISALKGAYEISVMQIFEGKAYACNVQQRLDAS